MSLKKILITSISNFDPSPFKDLGYDPIKVSTIRIVPDPHIVGEFRRGVIDGRFDSASFMSPRAIGTLSPDAPLVGALSAMRVYAVGPSTERSLEEYGIRVAGVPRKYTSAALAELIAEENENAPFRKMAVARSSLADMSFSEKLAELGIDAEEYRIYTIVPDIVGINSFINALREGLDVAAFTSRSSVQLLLDYLASCGRETEVIDALKGIRVIAMGPETAKGLNSAGIDHEVLEIHTIDGLALYLKGDPIWNRRGKE